MLQYTKKNTHTPNIIITYMWKISHNSVIMHHMSGSFAIVLKMTKNRQKYLGIFMPTEKNFSEPY